MPCSPGAGRKRVIRETYFSSGRCWEPGRMTGSRRFSYETGGNVMSAIRKQGATGSGLIRDASPTLLSFR